MIIEAKIKTNSPNPGVYFEPKTNSYRIQVKAVPERGKANEEALSLLAKYFKLPKATVRIIKGKTAGRKTFLIDDL